MQPQDNKAYAERALAIRANYAKVFSTPEGVEVLKDLMDSTGVMGPSLDFENPNQQLTAFNEGAKSIFYRIVNMLEMDPDRYLQMVRTKVSEEDEIYDT